mmetsp:Transcript_38236/g.108077  ORF Transcript_38236/g.108077 Transcript_38236/m.108077 type:complete len:102 (-) Transcript_38236:1868-2173(-)
MALGAPSPSAALLEGRGSFRFPEAVVKLLSSHGCAGAGTKTMDVGCAEPLRSSPLRGAHGGNRGDVSACAGLSEKEETEGRFAVEPRSDCARDSSLISTPV